MNTTPEENVKRILASTAFQKLTAARASLRWGLSIATLVIFFGFIVLISSASDLFHRSILNGTLPLGMAGAFAMIGSMVVLTGYYVSRSNAYLDALTQSVQRECEQ